MRLVAVVVFWQAPAAKMARSRRVAGGLVGLMLAAIACGNAPTATPVAPPPSAEAGSSTPKATEELPASESFPPGITPPLPEELAYLASSCKPYVEVYEQTLKRDASLADTLIITPPTLEGVADPARCAKILTKRVAVSRIREIEREPIAFIQTVADLALARKGVCASAPAVPPELGMLAGGAITLSRGAFRGAVGWTCLQVPQLDQTHAQFEYRSYPKERVFEVIARLHSVPKEGATELFVRASYDEHTEDYKVLRRAPTPPLKEMAGPIASGSASSSSSPSSSSDRGAASSAPPPAAGPSGKGPNVGKPAPAASAPTNGPKDPPKKSDGTTTL
jgi:hypothetical protein